MTFLVFVLCFVWWFVGSAGFLFWFSKDFDIDGNTVLLSCLIGLSGPLSWIMGWWIHGDIVFGWGSKVFIKKRK